MGAEITKETMKEWASESQLIEFKYKNDRYKAVGGCGGSEYWVFYKNKEEIGSVKGFDNVFTYKFIEDKSMLDIFDEIEPTLEFD